MSVEEVTKFIVTVRIPEMVWRNFNDSREFDRMFVEATSGSIESGTDAYSTPEVYAHFWTKKAAEQCDTMLLVMIQHFKSKLKCEHCGRLASDTPSLCIQPNWEHNYETV